MNQYFFSSLLLEDDEAIGVEENGVTGLLVGTNIGGDSVGASFVSFLETRFVDANMSGAQEGSVLVSLKHLQDGRWYEPF